MNELTGPVIPIACSLTAAELGDRRAAWRKLLGSSLVSRDRIQGGLRLTVHPGSARALEALVDLERECCPWISFQITGSSVSMTAQGDGEDVLDAMFG